MARNTCRGLKRNSPAVVNPQGQIGTSNQMQHQPSKSTQDVNREWTPEERDQIATLAAAVNDNPLLSLKEKIDALIDLIREEPK